MDSPSLLSVDKNRVSYHQRYEKGVLNMGVLDKFKKKRQKDEPSNEVFECLVS